MKNFVRIFAVVIAAVLMMSVVAFAEGEPVVTITNEVIDEDAGLYAFRVAAESTTGFKVFTINFSYNSDVVIPYDYEYKSSFDVTDTETNYTEEYISGVYYKDTNKICFDVASKLSLDVTLYEIDAENNRTAVFPTFSTTSTRNVHKSGTIFDYYYTLADGKTLADVVFALEGEDTTFANIKASDPSGASVHVFAQDTTGAYLYGSKGEITVDAFFDKEEPTEHTIFVPAGTKVYYVDGSVTPAFDVDMDIVVPKEAGFIYLNGGFDTHTIYAVDADGVPTKISGLDNAVVSLNGAGIRTSGVQGIRFRASASNVAKDLVLADANYEIAEYGFIVTAETNKTGFNTNDYELVMAHVDSGKAKKGVAYNKADGTDLIFSKNDDETLFTSVLKNIPLNKSSLEANIVSRPYYVLSYTDTNGKTQETIVYGEIVKRNVYGVALAIKEANSADYTDNKDYIDNVIAIVEGTQVAQLSNEIALDISKLYE